MSNIRTICGPRTVFSSLMCCSRYHHFHQARSRIRVSFRSPNFRSSSFSPWFDFSRKLSRKEPWFRVNQSRTVVTVSNWTDQKSPYEILVYDGKGALEEGETAEARFIKIQAVYELLIDVERRRQYDMDNRVNLIKASQAWMEGLIKKRKSLGSAGRYGCCSLG